MSYGELFSTRLVADEDFEAAVEQATREIETDPDEPEAWFNRGQAQAGLGKLEEAAQDYAHALGLDTSASNLDPAALDDELFEVLRRLALAHRADRDQALSHFQRYQTLLPSGRHVPDVPKWVAHIDGVEAVWVRDQA
ncbi:MAG: tetratricopeptide repeat protein [Myxococcales bacterium]|nr:tetratricopeptide repeat protein [Myxococcales bacterium]